MTKTPSSSFRCAAASLTLLLTGATAGFGSIIVQELFDGIAGPPPGTDSTLDGKGDTSTSVGMTGTWATNGSTGINTASNFNVGGGLPGPSFSNGDAGGLWNATGSWNTSIYATRALATTISFSTDQTLYFSARLYNPGDTSMGIGLASGANGSSEFIGAGFSWNSATGIGGTSNDADNAAYISYGTLDANSGVYGIRAHEAAGSVNGYGLLVGRITISSTGSDLIDIKRYAPGSMIDDDPSLVTWSASDSVNSSMEASHMLLWLNGNGGNGELDAIRLGQTWFDVTSVPETGSTVLCALGLALSMRRRR